MSNSKLSIHLSYNGNCAEAFSFYERALGAKIDMMMTYGASPMAGAVPPEEAGLVMHATLNIGGDRIVGADSTSSHPYQGSVGFGVSLDYTTLAEAERVFHALAEGGTLIMPFGPTFWSKGFGMVTDRFGVAWMIGAEQAG